MCGVEVFAFFLIFVCSLFFATSVSASVTIEGNSTPYEVAIGDTLSITSRKDLQAGENFVRWEIVSGTGTFTDATEDSTGFIPSSNNVVIRRVTRILPIYEITDSYTKFIYSEHSSIATTSSLYGIRAFFDSREGGRFLITSKFQETTMFLYFYGDSTFKTYVPLAPTDSFSGARDCYNIPGYRKCIVNVQPDTNYYLFFYASGYPLVNMKDSIFLKVSQTYTLKMSHTGNGTAYVDSISKNGAGIGVQSYSWVVSSDTSKIYAVPGNDNVFDHWEVVSGSCSVLDNTKDTTAVVNVKSDCNVRAVFRAGVVYPVSGTPTRYNFNDHVYAKQASSGSAGVRFLFVAPNSGTYTVVVSNEITQDSAVYIRYTATDYKTETVKERFLGTHVETMNLTAGDEVAIVIGNGGKGANPFYISYSTQANRILLSADSYGKVLPAGGYATAYAGSRYSISAESIAEGFRFSNWQIVSGSPTIDDSNAPYTYVIIQDNVELKARFKASSVYTLSDNKKTFNFQDNYYSESTRSAIRFKWTPPDANAHIITFEAVDPLGSIFKEYRSDSTFTTALSEKQVSGTMSFTVRGTPGVPLYWTLQDSSSAIPNTSFKAWISTPYVLNVISAKEGAAYPSGKIYTAPGDKTILTAWPHGGYKFKSWVNTEGDMVIDSPKDSRTTVTLKDSSCTIKATFTVDHSAEPSLNISKLDLGTYPEICAVVSVSDKNSGNSFYGLVSEDFTVTQDGVPVTPEVTSINNVTGVSVVIVVDESGSMIYNDRMEKTKESIQNFIDNMGAYDRTAIVGFHGWDSTVVHQKMTSDKSLLTAAVGRLAPDMNALTNIIVGAYVGLEQIVDEINPTAVIIFSDGIDDGGHKSLRDAVELSKAKKTPIHSIGLETDSRYPLEDLAVNTGGTLTFADDASELAGIYAAIRDNVMSQYMVCYQTPDTVQNGETHTVVIGTKLNKISTSDTARWSENTLPPIITLTENTKELIAKTQPSDTPLTIGVYIRTSLEIVTANLYLKKTNALVEEFSPYALQHVRDSLWEFTVPANLVVAPGLDFYVIALDKEGQIGRSPNIATPSMEPFTIFIDNDIPSVETVSVACEDSTTDTKTFTFRLSDSDGIGSAILYFKNSSQFIYDALPLAYSEQKDTWTAEFPANVRDYDMIFYYLRVTDATGASVRAPTEGILSTEACRIHFVDDPNDTSTVTDPIPEDSILPPSPRDSIEYSLIADTAEIYDKDLDGRADYVRVHFKEENDDNISSIDSIFWNSNRGEWRYVPQGTIKKDRADGKWYGAYINKPYKYGLTKADTIHKPFLSFTSTLSDKLENVVLTDRVGAVPIKAIKFPGKIGLEEYMDPNSELPPDTLIVTMSEPITNVGKDNAWEKIFRFSSNCEDTVSQEIKFRHAPQIHDKGRQWTIILDEYTLKAGNCLFTDPSATYEDLAGNSLGRGGIEISGTDGSIYLSEVRPVKPVSGKGKSAKWIPPDGSDWEKLPDSISAISVKAMMPYKAEIFIFDGIGTYVTDFKQKFGNKGEMEDPARGNPGDKFKQGFLHWDQRSDKGRRVGTGIYIWKIFFKFEDGHKETRIIKTGIYRKNRGK